MPSSSAGSPLQCLCFALVPVPNLRWLSSVASARASRSCLGSASRFHSASSCEACFPACSISHAPLMNSRKSAWEKEIQEYSDFLSNMTSKEYTAAGASPSFSVMWASVPLVLSEPSCLPPQGRFTRFLALPSLPRMLLCVSAHRPLDTVLCPARQRPQQLRSCRRPKHTICTLAVPSPGAAAGQQGFGGNVADEPQGGCRAGGPHPRQSQVPGPVQESPGWDLPPASARGEALVPHSHAGKSAEAPMIATISTWFIYRLAAPPPWTNALVTKTSRCFRPVAEFPTPPSLLPIPDAAHLF